jgi:hypothetical protein
MLCRKRVHIQFSPVAHLSKDAIFNFSVWMSKVYYIFFSFLFYRVCCILYIFLFVFYIFYLYIIFIWFLLLIEVIQAEFNTNTISLFVCYHFSPYSTIFQLYDGGQFLLVEETTDLPQVNWQTFSHSHIGPSRIRTDAGWRWELGLVVWDRWLNHNGP